MPHIKIQIAVAVGEIGNIAACEFKGKKTEWRLISDEVANYYDTKKGMIVCDGAVRRCVVTAFVEPPTVDAVEANQVDSV